MPRYLVVCAQGGDEPEPKYADDARSAADVAEQHITEMGTGVTFDKASLREMGRKGAFHVSVALTIDGLPCGVLIVCDVERAGWVPFAQVS